MSSKCSCSTPPGGEADCPSDHLAICRSQNGTCKTYCRAIPDNLSLPEVINWQINLIRNENRPLYQEPTIDDFNFLSEGRHIIATRGEDDILITFSSPIIGLGL